MRPSPDTEIDWNRLGGSISGILRRAGITTIGHLQLLNEAELFDLNMMGAKRIEEIKLYLSDHDLKLRGRLSFAYKAMKVYGLVEATPIRPLIALLSFGELSTQGVTGMVEWFAAMNMRAIGDIPRHQPWQDTDALTDAQLNVHERVYGWLIGAEVHWL